MEAGADAIGHAADGSWWECDRGSRAFHWRWPEFYQETIRDGLPVHFVDRAPIYQIPQTAVKDPKLKAAIVRMLKKARERAYAAGAMSFP